MTIKENVTGLQHLGIPAADLQESIRWYTELLGFEVIEEKNLPEAGCHVAFVIEGIIWSLSFTRMLRRL